jgi:hypothetical protein
MGQPIHGLGNAQALIAEIVREILAWVAIIILFLHIIFYSMEHVQLNVVLENF